MRKKRKKQKPEEPKLGKLPKRSAQRGQQIENQELRREMQGEEYYQSLNYMKRRLHRPMGGLETSLQKV